MKSPNYQLQSYAGTDHWEAFLPALFTHLATKKNVVDMSFKPKFLHWGYN
jgi:hypothetical protein